MEFMIYNRWNRLLDTVHGTELAINCSHLECSEGMLTIRFSVPIIDLHGYWKPDLFRPRMQLDWKIRLESSGNRNFPYIALFNSGHCNRLSFYSTNLLDDTVIELAMNQRECSYDVTVKIAIIPETEPFELVFDRNGVSWTELLQNCRKRLGCHAPAVPAAAWEPVYCTWYARHAALTTKFLDEAAELAAELGFGTFIVDDGWCYECSRRVTPENAPVWYEEIGSWKVAEQKLPDFAEHVRRTRRLGLRYLLWVAPFFLGEKQIRPDSAPCVGGEPGSYRVFDPACRTELDRVLRELRMLFRDYTLDGLKMDFLAHVPTELERPHGRATWNAIRELSAAVHEANPDSLIEFRQFYSTPATLGLATQFRANDTPFDYLENLHRIAQLRLMLGDGTAVHADPVYWHPRESASNVARHMAAAVAGVPMVSMDLAKLSAKHREILCDWLAFYRRHQEHFRYGHWTVRYDGSQLVTLSVERGRRKIVWLLSAAGLGEAAGAYCVVNPSAETWHLSTGPLAPGCRFEELPESVVE
ncbi:alpha-galactosidase [bacterium]|nr:alpha-galactosidase [bacterium]